MKLSLVGGEINRNRFGLPKGEGPDIAAARSVDDSRESVQPFNVRDELDPFVSRDVALGKSLPDPVKFRLLSENRLSPSGCGCLVQGLRRLCCPVRLLAANMVHRLVDKGIRLRHVSEALLIPDKVGAKRVQQNEQVMATQAV